MHSLRSTCVVTTSRRWVVMNSDNSSTSILPVGVRPYMRPLRMLRHAVQDVTQGSPYGTETLNAFTSQFKRIASIQGDLMFQGPRRFFLEHQARKQRSWSFGTTPPSSLSVLPGSQVPPLCFSEQHHEILTTSWFSTWQSHQFPCPPNPLTLVASGA